MEPVGELYCLQCLSRVSSARPAQMLLCRHLACTWCCASSQYCPRCGDLSGNAVKPNFQSILPVINSIGDTLNAIENGAVTNTSDLQQKIYQIEQEMNFAGVPCKWNPGCTVRGCPYDHQVSQMRSLDRELVEGEEIVLQEDTCKRCNQPVRVVSVPFCVNCGYVEDVKEGRSVPNPLQPL